MLQIRLLREGITILLVEIEVLLIIIIQLLLREKQR